MVDLEKDALKAADDYVAVVDASQHTSFQDGYFAGFAAGIEAAAKVAEGAAYVERCADDTMAGVRRANKFSATAAAIRSLAAPPTSPPKPETAQ